MLTEHTAAPAFTLLDQDGAERTLSAVTTPHSLIYFYPKDDTPGCTKEACAIRDAYADFARLGVTVFGVSADSVASHKKFADKYELPFTLLSDPTKETIAAYGAKNALGGTARVSYLLDQHGTILKVYPKVDPTTHGGTILKDILALRAN